MKKPHRRLTEAERAEAMLVAEELLIQRSSPQSVGRALRQEYGVSEAQARDIVTAVLRQFSDDVKAYSGERRAQHVRVLDRLFNRAWTDGKLQVCVEVERLLQKVEGHEAPRRHVVDMPQAQAADKEFEGRTPDDLLYYAEHGYFPEDAPKAAKGASPRQPFPLH